MGKSLKIFIGIIVLAVVGYGIYIYRDRFWEGGRGNSDYKSGFDLLKKNTNDEGINTDNVSTKEVQQNNEANQAKKEKYLEDCDSKCISWKDSEYLECLGICGLPEDMKKEANLSCEQRTGDDKDKCFKDTAIKEKNDSICDKIVSQAIKDTCVNAVAEQVLEGP